jgi:hypothetical protein
MDVELEYIPMGSDRTIILAGCFMATGYAVKIGLFPGDLPRETRGMKINSAEQFRYLRLMYPTQRGSIFDLDSITPMGRVDSAEVKFSEAERFANGTETLFTAFNLKTVLRTILPHDGGITVLQFMVKQHGQSIGLMTFGNADRYVSTVYDVIGGPLVEDKKGLD